jgi:Na+/melibiose symporter-like transporter
MTEKHWLLNRDDPRTVFLVCVLVALVGVFAIPHLLGAGGAVQLFAIGWIVASVAQLVWSGLGLRKFLASRD